MIDENISQEDLLKVMKARRRSTRPLAPESLDAGEAVPPAAKPAAKAAPKPDPKADK